MQGIVLCPMFVPSIEKTRRRGNNLSVMKTKLKHLFFLATLALSATACGGGLAKPTSGFDISVLSPKLLSVNPAAVGQADEEVAAEADKPDIDQQEKSTNTIVN